MPTEKDVKYYESLVMKEVADKTLSFGCRVKYMKNRKDWCTWWMETGIWKFIDSVFFLDENYDLEDCTDFSSTNPYMLKPYSFWILWHEVMIGDFLEHIEQKAIDWVWYNRAKNSRFVDIICDVLSLRGDKRLPYSALPDNTKIELGKIVEKVLFSNQEK